MPVTKFRTIEEMNAFDSTRWLEANDPRLARLIQQCWDRFRDFFPPLNLPKGVHKFRSIEEMNAFKERYEKERTARMQAERVRT
jgi:hypothetical protein